MPLIRSISGLRATLGDSLTPKVINDYTSAFAEYCPEGDIVIGRDGRPSGRWIEQAVAASLIACGRIVRCIGIAPTPTVQLLTEKNKAAGGIAITASHNPSEWNGLKFISSDGTFLDSDGNKKLWEIVDSGKYHYSIDIEFPEIIYDNNALDYHINSIFQLGIFQNTDFIEQIKSRGFKVVVDAVNSSGSMIVPELLHRFGCEVIDLFCANNGIFPHNPEPVPENLLALAEAVKSNKADFGIAVDPDADRLALIDEYGSPIGEELTICISADAALSNVKFFSETNKSSLVINHSTTRLADDIAEKYGTEVFRSPVGEINVVNKMKESNALIGGEGSGGVILPALHYGRDSLAGISLVLLRLAQTGLTLSELKASYPVYTMIKTKMPFSGSILAIIEKFKRLFNDAEILIEDGMKAIYKDRWIQIRTSNTEPIIRIISEAPNEKNAGDLIQLASGIIK